MPRRPRRDVGSLARDGSDGSDCGEEWDVVETVEEKTSRALRDALHLLKTRAFRRADALVRKFGAEELQCSISLIASSEGRGADELRGPSPIPFSALLRLLLNYPRTRSQAAKKAFGLMVASKLTTSECSDCVDEVRYAIQLPWDFKSRNILLGDLLMIAASWFHESPEVATDDGGRRPVRGVLTLLTSFPSYSANIKT